MGTAVDIAQARLTYVKPVLALSLRCPTLPHLQFLEAQHTVCRQERP